MGREKVSSPILISTLRGRYDQGLSLVKVLRCWVARKHRKLCRMDTYYISFVFGVSQLQMISGTENNGPRRGNAFVYFSYFERKVCNCPFLCCVSIFPYENECGVWAASLQGLSFLQLSTCFTGPLSMRYW